MSTRILATLGVIGALSVSPAQAQFTPKLDSVYSFARISGAWSDDCAAPSFDEVLGAEFGTVSFHADGSLTTNTTDYTLCSGGSFYTGPDVENGTYTLDASGLLLMDMDPQNPGTNVIPLHMSRDHKLAVASAAMGGAPQLVIALQQAKGMTSADLSGMYNMATIGLEFFNGGSLEVEPQGGSAQFDGISKVNLNYAGMDMMLPGTTQSFGNDIASYAVLANGQVSVEGAPPSGAISQDGEVGFVLFADPSSGLELNLFLKGAPTEATPTLAGDWWAMRLGGQKPTQSGEVSLVEVDGTLNFGPLGGAVNLAASRAWLDTQGGGAGPELQTGSYGVGLNGEVLFNLSDGQNYSCWLGNNQDLMLMSNWYNDYLDASMGVLVRARGALEADVSTVSEALGGVQSFSLAAPPNLAGAPYFLLGSRSGIWPGLPFGTETVPLNLDNYLLFTMLNPNSMPLTSSSGLLDPNGLASASFTLPPAFDPALVGVILNHAFVVLDPLNLGEPSLVSNPASLEILP